MYEFDSLENVLSEIIPVWSLQTIAEKLILCKVKKRKYSGVGLLPIATDIINSVIQENILNPPNLLDDLSFMYEFDHHMKLNCIQLKTGAVN